MILNINEGLNIYSFYYLVLSLAVLFNITKFLEVTLGRDFIILHHVLYTSACHVKMHSLIFDGVISIELNID